MFSRADKMILCLLSEKFAADSLASSSSFLASAARPILDSVYARLYCTCTEGGMDAIKVCVLYEIIINSHSKVTNNWWNPFMMTK